jgi:hypothetical protein
MLSAGISRRFRSDGVSRDAATHQVVLRYFILAFDAAAVLLQLTAVP